MTTLSTDSKEFPNLTGRQEPHHKSEVTEGDDTHGHKAVKLATRLRAVPMPWQVWALLAILRTTVTGEWVHPDVVLIVPRQNGKTLILTLRVMYGLFVLGERIIFCSQRWPTAEDAYNRVMTLIGRSASLRKRVTRNVCGQGQGKIELSNGAEILFATRSNDTARGFDRVDLVIYDESYNLTDGHISAISYTQMASKNPQSIYASSAVNQEQHPNGAVLSGLRRKGLACAEGILFGEWMAPEGMPYDEEPTWQYANPSYGVIHSAAKIRKALRAATTAAGRRAFGVEALGRGDWPVDEDDREAVVPAEVWAKMANPAPKLTGSIVVGVDRAPKNGRWAVAAAQWTTDERIHIEVGMFAAATLDQVVDFVVQIVELWDPAAVVLDSRSPASVLVPRLVAKGIEPECANTPSMARWSGGILEDALDAKLSHSDQPSLTDAVNDAVQRLLPQGDFVWERTDEGSTIPLTAATLAHGGLIEFGVDEVKQPEAVAFEATVSMPQELNVMEAAW